MRPVIINPCGGSPLQPPSPAKGTKRKMQAWEHGPSSGGSQLQAGPVSPAEQPRAWGTPRPQPPAAAGYCSPSRAKIGLLNYCMQMDNRKEKRTGMNCARRKTEAHTRKINYSAVTFQLWLTVIWTKTKKHLSWWRQKNLLVLQNNRYNCLGEKKKRKGIANLQPKGLLLFLPPPDIICHCLKLKLARFSSLETALGAKWCPVTQPLRKLFADKQLQLLTSKPCLNTNIIKARQSKEQTLHLSQSTLK